MATKGKGDSYSFDELLCFLSNPLFQVPILSFMETHCLIFDTSTEDSREYRRIHQQYRMLVDTMLEAFRSDTGLTHDDIIQAMKNFNAKPEVRQIFQELFEQVLAMDDFPIFVHLMINKNLELQKQALMLISMLQGHLPNSLQEGGMQAAVVKITSRQDEDEILKAVLEQSLREYEAQEKQNRQQEEEYRAVLHISQVESQRLEQASRHGQEKLCEVLKSSMHLNDSPSPTEPGTGDLASLHRLPELSKEDTKATSVEAAGVVFPSGVGTTSLQQKPEPVTSAPVLVLQHNASLAPVKQGAKSVSSTEAAADWLKAAGEEVRSSEVHSQAVYAAAANMAGMNEEEYKRRVNFLKQQRDKLMEMKRKEREKRLLSAASSQPARPASAHAARIALHQTEHQEEAAPSPEEQKKLAMRRAIANRIKSELMEEHKN